MKIEEFVERVKGMGPGARVTFKRDPRDPDNEAERAFMQAAALTLRERSLALAVDMNEAPAGLRWWVVPACQCDKCRMFGALTVFEEQQKEAEQRAHEN